MAPPGRLQCHRRCPRPVVRTSAGAISRRVAAPAHDRRPDGVSSPGGGNPHGHRHTEASDTIALRAGVRVGATCDPAGHTKRAPKCKVVGALRDVVVVGMPCPVVAARGQHAIRGQELPPWRTLHSFRHPTRCTIHIGRFSRCYIDTGYTNMRHLLLTPV